MTALARDVRHAARALSKSPGFTLTAVLSLGLAIGAGTALFSIFNALLWTPIRAREPKALVRLFARGPGQGRLYQNFSYPEYLDYRGETGAFQDLLASTGVEAGFRIQGADAARAFGEAVTDNYFRMLGVRPQLGRALSAPAGGTLNTAQEIVISHRFWQRSLDGDAAVIGKTVWLTGVPYTVVGVAPPGFNGTYPSPIFAPEFWVPVGTIARIDNRGEGLFDDRSARGFALLGRLCAGVTLGQARAKVAEVASGLERRHPASNKGFGALVFRELDTHPEVYSSRTLNLVALLFLGLAGLVLAVACANLANLTLAHAGARSRELALRLALGAGRGQIVRHVLAEAILLALAAAGIGLLAASAAARGVSAIRLPTDLPLAFDVALDGRAVAFTLAVSLAAALGFGLVPAIAASRPRLLDALKGGQTPGFGRARRAFGLANTLVVTQVALSLVLAVSAALFWRSVGGVESIDPGIQLAGRTLASFNPSLVRYDGARAEAFYGALLERLDESPHLRGVALVGWVPLGFAFDEASFVLQGVERQAGEQTTTVLLNVATPSFLEIAGVAVRRGRGFTVQDTRESLPVAIVNETLAARAWPGREAVGERLREDTPGASWLTVVGVMADGKYRTLNEPPQPCVLRPLAQAPRTSLTLVVRSDRGASAALSTIRQEVRSLDPGMPLLDAKTMEQQMAKVRFLPQAMTALAAPAAGLALLIAAVGLHGVMACAVGRRTREFGIRLAVGAQAREVVVHVMSQGMCLVGVGLSAGAVLALALAHLMRGALIGVAPSDPLSFLAAAGLLGGVGALAAYLPARRASRVDPVVALRHE